MDPLRLLRDAVAGDRILRVKIDADSIAFPIRNNTNKDGDDDKKYLNFLDDVAALGAFNKE